MSVHGYAAGVLLLSVALLVACKPAPVSLAGGGRIADENACRGATIAAVNCSRCHDIGANGPSPHPLAPSFGAIAGQYPLDYLRNTLEGGPGAGHLGMPAIEIGGAEIEALQAYMRSLNSCRREGRAPHPRNG